MAIYISIYRTKMNYPQCKIEFVEAQLQILRMFGAISRLNSLHDVKIFNTAGGLLSFREIPHC